MTSTSSTSELTALLLMSVWSAPFLIIYVAGALLSLSRWRQYPTASRLAFLAFIGFLFRVLLGVVRNWLTLQHGKAGWSTMAHVRNMGIINTIDIVVGVIGWILLLIAFYKRTDPPMFHGAE